MVQLDGVTRANGRGIHASRCHNAGHHRGIITRLRTSDLAGASLTCFSVSMRSRELAENGRGGVPEVGRGIFHESARCRSVQRDSEIVEALRPSNAPTHCNVLYDDLGKMAPPSQASTSLRVGSTMEDPEWIVL